MAADYFSVAEFRAWAPKAAQPYTDAEINDAQTEVLERLELWARTAWKTRTATEKFDAGQRGYVLSGYPVIAISAFTDAGDVVSVADFVTDLSGGVLWYDTSHYNLSPPDSRQGLSVTYTYGYSAVPRSVKRACMAATVTLLPHVAEQKAGRIPPNTTEYRTEGATFVIEPGDTGDEPWPWDAVASRDMRSYYTPGPLAARI